MAQMERTTLFARIFGLWTLLAVSGMVANRQTTIDILNAFFDNPALMWVTGLFTLLAGVVIVVAHSRWSGGALAVVVTIYGWIVFLKGLAFVWLPGASERAFYDSLHFDQYFYGYFAVSLVIGAYLTYGGFKRNPPA